MRLSVIPAQQMPCLILVQAGICCPARFPTSNAHTCILIIGNDTLRHSRTANILPDLSTGGNLTHPKPLPVRQLPDKEGRQEWIKVISADRMSCLIVVQAGF